MVATELSKVRLQLGGHELGIDAGDPSLVLPINQFAEVALSTSPSDAVRHQKQVSIRSLLVDDAFNIPEDISLLASRCPIAFHFDQDTGIFLMGDREVGLFRTKPGGADKTATRIVVGIAKDGLDDFLGEVLKGPSSFFAL